MGADKRRFKRLDIRIPAQVSALEAEVLPLDTTIVNLGPEGAFCEAANCLPQGTAVRVSFLIGDGEERIQADGEVRWVKEQEEQTGMGVQFTRLSQAEKDSIYRFILLKLAESRGLR